MISGEGLHSAREIPFSRALYDVLVAAKGAAQRTGDPQVRAEHVLLALLDAAQAPRAARVLGALGVEPARLRGALEQEPAAVPSPGERPWDRRAKAVLERGVGHARRRGVFTTDDLLLAVAEGRSGLAAELLRWQSLTPERLRQVSAALGDGGEA